MALIKNDNKQKKHKGENIIGKIIYGFLLFAPLLSILFTSLYATFNKNAYQSYSQTIATTTIELNANNIGAYYVDKQIVTIYKETQKSYGSRSGVFGATNFTFDPNELAGTTNINYVGFEFYTSSAVFWYLYDDLGTSHRVEKVDMPDIWSYQVDLSTYTRNSVYQYYNASVLVNTKGSLDNAFEYGIQKVEESNLYNWSKTTGTYTVLTNTCNLLGINNTFVPMLLAYWLIISVIYFIYDIALILVWMVHKKIHELTDAI